MTGSGPKLRIGLIGAGMVSEHHLKAWAAIDEAQVVAIADPTRERAEARADAFGIAATYDDARRMLAEQSCDAVDIAAPVDRHGLLCRTAADAGAAILCQKPLAARSEEARAIVDAVGARVRFMVHENWRFRSSYRQIKAWLDVGSIGRVESVRLSVTSSGLLRDGEGRYPALLRQPFLAKLPRLLVFEVLIHHIDVLRWLFGPLRVESARLSRQCPAVLGEDSAEIDFGTADSRQVRLAACLTDPLAPAHISDHLTITGDEGSITLADTRLSLEGARAEAHAWDLSSLYHSAFDGALRHFVTRLAKGEPFETEAADNIAVLRLVEEVYRAAGRARSSTKSMM